MSALSRLTAFRNFLTGTAWPRNTVRQPASSARRKKFTTPATWTHSPNAPATTILAPSPLPCVDKSTRLNHQPYRGTFLAFYG
jgi:hypothetical protein